MKDFVSNCEIIIIFCGNLVQPGPLRIQHRAKIVFADGTGLSELAKIPVSEVNHIFKRELLSRLNIKIAELISLLPFGTTHIPRMLQRNNSQLPRAAG